MKDLARDHLIHLLLRSTNYINNCWVFGNKDARYPLIKLAGKVYTVHRVSAHIYHGLDIMNEDQQVNHKPECEFSSCWRPEHIYLGTQSENIKDQVIKGTHYNGSKTHCIRGHVYDSVIRRNGKIVSRRCNQCRRITG